MQTGRYSGPSAVADVVRMQRQGRLVPLLATLLCALSLAGPSRGAAQQPELRVEGASATALSGRMVAGAAAYPAHSLELLGFTLAATPAALTAALGSDTLRFWPTSPYFRDGARVHQLALPVAAAEGTVWFPEQFFIQWLPAAYPDRFEFRGGALVVRPGAMVADRPSPQPSAVAATRPPGQAQRQPAGTRPAASDARVVIIDPGHGGRDPGKVAPNGLREKDVTLMISQRLASVLRDRGYEVHMTRTADTLIALADRPRMANRWRGDRQGAVFLSIHANSAPPTSARGFETFFLSEARTEDERRVAELENAAIRFEDPADRPAATGLDAILSNLHSDFLTRASHDLAAVMQEKLATFHPGPNRGVKRAGFYVLVGAVMPAVLVETAFLSNRDEANMLGTQAFQQSLAWGIADAVDEFFRRNEHLWAGAP
jgi:N-acetylmuramoyl-L-alanine amidase